MSRPALSFLQRGVIRPCCGESSRSKCEVSPGRGWQRRSAAQIPAANSNFRTGGFWLGGICAPFQCFQCARPRFSGVLPERLCRCREVNGAITDGLCLFYICPDGRTNIIQTGTPAKLKSVLGNSVRIRSAAPLLAVTYPREIETSANKPGVTGFETKPGTTYMVMMWG